MSDTGHEKLTLRASSESPKNNEKSAQKPEAVKDVHNRAHEVLQGNEDSVDASEGAEGDGRVSENEGNASENKSSTHGSAAKARTTDEIEAIRARLLKSAPSQETMVKQIKKHLYKEERQLEKELSSLEGKAAKNAYEMANVVAKLRKLKEYFSILAHATFELVKHLWLKIVHGV